MGRTHRSLIRAYTNKLPDSSLRYVLESLLPYSRANMHLTFSPVKFFDDLEQISHTKSNSYKRETLRRSYHQAVDRGYIDIQPDGTPALSADGRHAIEPYRPTKLPRSELLVIFDIPESRRRQRDQFRLLLRELKFQQIQKSVWSSPFDSREVIMQATKELQVQKYIELRESIRLTAPI